MQTLPAFLGRLQTHRLSLFLIIHLATLHYLGRAFQMGI